MSRIGKYFLWLCFGTLFAVLLGIGVGSWVLKSDRKEFRCEWNMAPALAITECSREIESSDPDDGQWSIVLAGSYVVRGNAYLKTGDYDRAIADFDKAIEIAPQDAFAYDSRGWAYYQKGSYRLAIADLDKAIEKSRYDPFPNAYGHRSLAYWRVGDHQRAIEDFRNGLAMEGADPDRLSPKEVKLSADRLTMPPRMLDHLAKLMSIKNALTGRTA